MYVHLYLPCQSTLLGLPVKNRWAEHTYILYYLGIIWGFIHNVQVGAVELNTPLRDISVTSLPQLNFPVTSVGLAILGSLIYPSLNIIFCTWWPWAPSFLSFFVSFFFKMY